MKNLFHHSKDVRNLKLDVLYIHHIGGIARLRLPLLACALRVRSRWTLKWDTYVREVRVSSRLDWAMEAVTKRTKCNRRIQNWSIRLDSILSPPKIALKHFVFELSVTHEFWHCLPGSPALA